jgi:hypothetical protein
MLGNYREAEQLVGSEEGLIYMKSVTHEHLEAQTTEVGWGVIRRPLRSISRQWVAMGGPSTGQAACRLMGVGGVAIAMPNCLQDSLAMQICGSVLGRGLNYNLTSHEFET